MKVLFNELRRLKEWNLPNPLKDMKTIKTAERELSYLTHDQITQLLTFVQRSPISGQATHILRHTFASYFMMNGGNILVLQKILGHADIKQTMAYSHFAPSHLQDAVLFNLITRVGEYPSNRAWNDSLCHQMITLIS